MSIVSEPLVGSCWRNGRERAFLVSWGIDKMPRKQQIARENQELKQTLKMEERERREKEEEKDREIRQMRRENAALQVRLEALD